MIGNEAPTLMHFKTTSSFQATAKQPPRARNVSETSKYAQEKVGVPGGVFVTCL